MLDDNTLLKTYLEALNLKLDNKFVNLLRAELNKRAIL
nr:sporulation histidine kinase inhibitor Sda [Thalassobacillus sp. CUG 92003]